MSAYAFSEDATVCKSVILVGLKAKPTTEVGFYTPAEWTGSMMSYPIGIRLHRSEDWHHTKFPIGMAVDMCDVTLRNTFDLSSFGVNLGEDCNIMQACAEAFEQFLNRKCVVNIDRKGDSVELFVNVRGNREMVTLPWSEFSLFFDAI